MIWVRKGLVQLLSLLLFVALVGGALSASANITVTHPDKIEAWLTRSNFYDSFITNALDQAQKSAANSGAERVSLSNPAVKQAAQKALPRQTLQQDVDTILHSNYAWLEGKTSTPNFNIDLTGIKQSFANQVGQEVQTRLSSLPVCTTAQLEQLAGSTQNLQNIDPLSIPCRLPGLDPAAEATLVKQDILANGRFLGQKTAITANSLNPSSTTAPRQPYYQELSPLPTLYRWSVSRPWMYAVVALFSAAGIIFLARTKRRGWRRTGIVLAVAGIVLVAIKFLADKSLPHVENTAFNNANIGPLRGSLTRVLHLMEAQFTRIDLWFGIAYLVLAALILGYLTATRVRTSRCA